MQWPRSDGSKDKHENWQSVAEINKTFEVDDDGDPSLPVDSLQVQLDHQRGKAVQIGIFFVLVNDLSIPLTVHKQKEAPTLLSNTN